MQSEHITIVYENVSNSIKIPLVKKWSLRDCYLTKFLNVKQMLLIVRLYIFKLKQWVYFFISNHLAIERSLKGELDH